MAYYALHKLKIRPVTFLEMDEYEKAFIFASIELRIEAEKKAAKEMKR